MHLTSEFSAHYEPAMWTVSKGVTGFVADTVEELAAAVKRVDVIDRAACRQHVQQHFSVSTMADHYELVYRALMP